MKPKGKTHSELRLAVPCYGDRVLPRFGQVRDFFLVDFDPQTRIVCGLQRRSWDPLSQPQLSRWLKSQGIWAVLCGGIHPRFQAALGAEEIGVIWGFRGEVEEVVKAWLLRFDTRDPFAGLQRRLGQGCAGPFRQVRSGCPRNPYCEGDAP